MLIYTNSYTTTSVPITPVAYFKVAVSFLALYNTSYARAMVDYLEPRLATPDGLFSAARGYKDGIDEQNRIVGTVVDKTNGLILAAANYALTKTQISTPISPSPYVSSNLLSPIPIFTATPTVVPSNSVLQSFSPLPSSTIPPQPTTSNILPYPTSSNSALSSPSDYEHANSLAPIKTSNGGVSSFSPCDSAHATTLLSTTSPFLSYSLFSSINSPNTNWINKSISLIALAISILVLIVLSTYIIKREK